MTIVDAHSHLFPPAWRQGTRMPPAIFDLDLIFQRQDQAGLSMTVLSDSHIWFGERDLGDIASAREYNDFAADVVRTHPGRLAALASTMPWRGPAHLAEAERAIRELGLAGLAIPTSDRGQYADDIPDEFWSMAEDLHVPVFMHPGRDVLSPDLMDIYRLGELCGRPMDMTVTLARLILTGGMQRHRDLALLCAHAGGAICMIADRLDFGHELRGYSALGPWGAVELDQPPSEYVSSLHLDTVTFGVRPLRLALETVGAHRLHFGTDGPPLPFPARRSRHLVDSLGLAPDHHADVMGNNAVRLFGLRHDDHLANELPTGGGRAEGAP
jgi:aminocarboxymuconate-semialdehyde decarboxylase